jgi:hypothetical protein
VQANVKTFGARVTCTRVSVADAKPTADPLLIVAGGPTRTTAAQVLDVGAGCRARELVAGAVVYYALRDACEVHFAGSPFDVVREDDLLMVGPPPTAPFPVPQPGA